MAQQVNWRQVWAEVGLLLVGALLAITVDAVWDERRERQEETVYISSIRADLEANAAGLDSLSGFYRDVYTADSTVLAYAQGSTDLSPDSVRSATMRAFTTRYFRPALSTYRDMIESGRLHLLRDPEIRKGLAEFAEEVEVLQTAIGILLNRWHTIEEPFMLSHLPTPSVWDGYPRGIDPVTQARLGTLSLLEPDAVPEPVPRSALLANQMALRMVLVYDVLLSIEWLRDELDELAALID